MSAPILAWHFLTANGRLRDGRLAPADGVLLRHRGPVVPCGSGLHASVGAMDALRYAPGPLVCRVKCGGEIVKHGSPVDKFACSERTILWRADATETLRAFARWCALRVIARWNAPQIVLQWLETGDEELREEEAEIAAEIAARNAARNAAASAAESAASAAESAAWSAAWNAERAAQAAELERLLLALAPEVTP